MLIIARSNKTEVYKIRRERLSLTLTHPWRQSLEIVWYAILLMFLFDYSDIYLNICIGIWISLNIACSPFQVSIFVFLLNKCIFLILCAIVCWRALMIFQNFLLLWCNEYLVCRNVGIHASISIDTLELFKDMYI